MSKVQLKVTEFGYDRTVHVANGSYSWLEIEAVADGHGAYKGKIGCITAEPLTVEVLHFEWPADMPGWLDRERLHADLAPIRVEALQFLMFHDGAGHKLQDHEALPIQRSRYYDLVDWRWVPAERR